VRLEGVVLSEAAFQAERRISRGSSPPLVPREIPRPAGESAGLRNDASELKPHHCLLSAARHIPTSHGILIALLESHKVGEFERWLK
jgi:hypothetical protein